MSSQLRRDGKRVALILATDGSPTDADGYIGDEDVDAKFFDALKSLEGLPVWLVIRLCTDEVKATQLYNEVDQKLGLGHKEWLNYCLPMHRCRESGFHHRFFDYLDEWPLTKGEDFCCVLAVTRSENIWIQALPGRFFEI